MCEDLLDYDEQRLEKYPYVEDKPTCANYFIHYYKADMWEWVVQVMRYTDPRMILEHHGVVFMYLLDGRKKAPTRLRRGMRANPEK